MASQIKITFTGGSLLGEERTFALDEPVVLGRSHSAAVRLKEPDVSGKHIEFRDETDGVGALCLSRNGFTLNGALVAEGESRRLRADDVLTLGARVRLRVDTVIAGNTASPAADDAATFATRVYEPSSEATVATQFARPEDVAPSGNETFATIMADAAAIAQDSPDSLQGSMEETPLGDADSMGGIALAHAPRSTSPADEAPTQDEHDAETSGDVAVDFGVNDDALDAQTTGADTGLSDGETVEMKTRQASMDEIFRMKRMLEAKKRFRRKLVTFALLSFLALIGTAIFVTWSQPEEELSQPRVAGTDELDIRQYVVRSPSGGVDMVVDYPNDPRMKVSPDSQDGVDVTTYTGRDRDVPFRLSFVRWSDMRQYHLSLAQSAELEMKAFEKKGYVFLADKTVEHLDPESREGFLFYEVETPQSCQVKVQQGTRFFRREYQRDDGGVKWHGMMTLLRNRDMVYRLMREVPEDIWPRASYMLHIDPNLSLYAGFLRRRWESPGDAALAGIVADERLEQSVQMVLSRGRTVDWSSLAREIDALIVAAATDSKEMQKRAEVILEEFRKKKDALYRELENRRDIAIMNESEAGLREALEKCRGAFQDDSSDLRSRIVQNPKEWPSCLPESF